MNCEKCEKENCETITVQVARSRNDTEEWCESCVESHAFTCADCERVFSNSVNTGENSNGDKVCEHCAENYFTCDSCEGIFSNDRCRSDSSGSGCYCERCVPDEHGTIAEYGADVPFGKIGIPPHYFGVELEVETQGDSYREQKAKQVRELLSDFVIVTEDGSLSHGFEIVTRPATLEKQLFHWKPFFDNVPSGLRSFQTDTCGLHVHASRRPLSQLQIAKIVCFVNAAHNRAFLKCIAARDSARWSRYHAKKLSDGNKVNPERYEAVNLQNRETIEFRIFKGTLKRESVFKAIEFCDALIKFCYPASRSIQDCISRVKFLEFVFQNKKTWPHLAAFVDAKWIGKETSETIKMGFKISRKNISEPITESEE
jgi:Putative amidoligase enzyme